MFGECSNLKAVAWVLQGNFPIPNNCDPFTAKFLEAIARPLSMADVPAHSTMAYCWGWQKSCETTGSSASGIHFGHYIAGTFNLEILVINAALADIPLWTGFSYDQWKKGLNIMLEKTVRDCNVEKLCIILLFKADFNANNKWISRTVMFQAESTHLLADKQFGSRKFKSAIHQCLNKHLFNDLVRFRRQPVALCSNDAKSCYNRITLLAATLCLCRLGSSLPMAHKVWLQLSTKWFTTSKLPMEIRQSWLLRQLGKLWWQALDKETVQAHKSGQPSAHLCLKSCKETASMCTLSQLFPGGKKLWLALPSLMTPICASMAHRPPAKIHFRWCKSQWITGKDYYVMIYRDERVYFGN